MGAGPWARRVLIGLSVGLTGLLLTGCTVLGLPEGDNLVRALEDEQQRNPPITIEGRAARFCEARAEADRAVALYGLLRGQLLADGDDATAAWLRDGPFGTLLFDLVRIAVFNDPRVVSLPPDQEPQRPELIALVCERCPQTAAATTQRQRELYEAPGRAPMCAPDQLASGVFTEVGLVTIHETWRSVWVLTLAPDSNGTASWEYLTPSGVVVPYDEVGIGTVVQSGDRIEVHFPLSGGGGGYTFRGALVLRDPAASQPNLVGELTCEGCPAGIGAPTVEFEFSGMVG